MKLELKHLAPYLPYGLKVGQPRCGKTEAYLMYGFKYSNYANEWIVNIDDSAHGDYQSSYLKGIKPILRPLSDLVKEIEHNGERFVPRNNDLLGKYEICTYPNFNFFDSFGSNENIEELPFYVIEKLFEWNFDVFNLIEEGLAIDINTLKP